MPNSNIGYMKVFKTERTNETVSTIETWLNNVAYGHSGSYSTERHYKQQFQQFCSFIDKTPEEILTEYDNSTDREFKHKYARQLQNWIAYLSRKNYTKGSIRVMTAAVKSFFKYNNLPIGFVPTAKEFVRFHNRDITKEEIVQLLSISHPRDKAFYVVMAQSGLRPDTICKLKLKHLEPDFSESTIPLKIEVPREIAKGQYAGYLTFIGNEAVAYLKDYLKTRINLTSESWVFTRQGTEEQASPKAFSHKFRKSIRKLRAKGIVNFEQKQKGKPSELRLYSLRKYFRKYAHQMGFENVQFLMGHVVKEGQEEHYRPKDPEFYRQLYKEKAMPYLRLETATPSETEQTIIELKRKVAELNEKLEERVDLEETVKRLESALRFSLAREGLTKEAVEDVMKGRNPILKYVNSKYVVDE